MREGASKLPLLILGARLKISSQNLGGKYDKEQGVRNAA
jgi:hypothetical protein